ALPPACAPSRAWPRGGCGCSRARSHRDSLPWRGPRGFGRAGGAACGSWGVSVERDRVDGLGDRRERDRRVAYGRHRAELARLEREKPEALEVDLGEFPQPVGAVQIGPFGVQHAQRLAHLADLGLKAAHLSQFALGPVILPVGPEAESHDGEGGEGEEAAAHQRWSFSAGFGRPRAARGASAAGASVRSPTRSLAERARGFWASSASSGATARRVIMRKAGSTCARSGAWRLPCPCAPERSWKKRFTMRSSSEWNVTTASRPPGFRARSAAARPSASWPNSSFTAMRIAWKLRVAGWLCPGFCRGRQRSITAASCRVREKGRAATMARAIRRAARSSP